MILTDPGAPSYPATAFSTHATVLLEKLNTIGSALDSVVKRLDRTESRLRSVEQKLQPSSSSCESQSQRMKTKVPTIVKVHAVLI